MLAGWNRRGGFSVENISGNLPAPFASLREMLSTVPMAKTLSTVAAWDKSWTSPWDQTLQTWPGRALSLVWDWFQSVLNPFQAPFSSILFIVRRESTPTWQPTA